jgi:hypothetical protein
LLRQPLLPPPTNGAPCSRLARRFVFREGRTKGIGVVVAAEGSAPHGTWDAAPAQGAAPAPAGAASPAAPVGACSVAAASKTEAGVGGARAGGGQRVNAP